MKNCLRLMTPTGEQVRFRGRSITAGSAPSGDGGALAALWSSSPQRFYADPVGEAHVRVRLRSGDGTMLNAVAFRSIDPPLGQALMKSRGQAIHAAGKSSRLSRRGPARDTKSGPSRRAASSPT